MRFLKNWWWLTFLGHPVWHHLSRVRSRTLKHVYRRPCLTVFEHLNLKMLSAVVWIPKLHFLVSQRVFWAMSVKIHPWVTSIGESGEKIKTKKKPFIARISPGAPLRPIGTNFGLLRLVDIINCANFYRNRLRGLVSVKGRNLTIPIGLRCRR